MAPTLLVIGSTGNTGRAVVKTVASEAEKSQYRIVGLTRNTASDAAKALAAVPHVEMMEKNWMEIDADWLRSHEVKRIFCASPNGPTAFIDETQLYKHALDAGVEYVVRISTTTSNVTAATPVFYGRAHWAIEQVLDSPEFSALKWTSLQPNVFTAMYVGMAQQWLQEYRKTGNAKLPVQLDENNGAAVVDSDEVGIIAGKLLALEDVSKHASQRYVIVGPEDMTGKQYKGLLEKHAKTTISDVSYRDLSFVEGLKGQGVFPDRLIDSLKNAPNTTFSGGASVKATPTSPEVMELYAPRNSAVKGIDEALAAM